NTSSTDSIMPQAEGQSEVGSRGPDTGGIFLTPETSKLRPNLSLRPLCNRLCGFRRRHRNGRNSRRRPPPCSGFKTFAHKLKDSPPILRNYLYPRHFPHHRKINTAETEPRQKNIDAIAERLIVQRFHRTRQCLGTISFLPPLIDFIMSFLDGHLQRRVRHRERYKLLPMFGPRQPACLLQPFVEGSRRQRGEQSKNRETWRPRPNLSHRPLRNSHRIIVHAENK